MAKLSPLGEVRKAQVEQSSTKRYGSKSSVSGVLALAAMDRLLRKAGAARVSISGKEALAKELEKHGVEVGKRAARFALHAGRKTITSKDIALALKS